jgi:Type IV secretion system proteins
MKIKTGSIIILGFCVCFFAAQTVKADSSTTSTTSAISLTQPAQATSTQGNVLGLEAPAVPPLIQEINNAKGLLANITLNHSLIPIYKNLKNKKTGKVTKTLSGYELGDKDIALAILDPSSNNIVITVGRLNGKTMVFPDPAVNVKLTNFNGVNSKFEVDQPANGTVLALKYLISGPDSGGKAAIENALSPAIYVPYSQNLDTPEIISYGQNYLNGVINTVTQQLYGLPSHAIPGETITQAVPPTFIKSLVYAEHSDTASILNGNAQGALDQMNILLALNGPDTYKYSVSTASARGIAQFVPSTYTALVARHPEAFLIPDFTTGMQDHINSIKAMYLLLDDYAGDVRVEASQGFVAARVFDYGAASYNGGVTRVAKAVNAFGDNWNADNSAQINALTGQITNNKYQITSLKAKIKKTADKKTKAALQAQLTSAQNQLASSNNQLATLQSSSLRNETVNYLAKIYKVIQFFNEQQLAMN